MGDGLRRAAAAARKTQVRRPPAATSAAGRARLERALATLGDYETEIRDSLREVGIDRASEEDLRHVRAALRQMLDDDYYGRDDGAED